MPHRDQDPADDDGLVVAKKPIGDETAEHGNKIDGGDVAAINLADGVGGEAQRLIHIEDSTESSE